MLDNNEGKYCPKHLPKAEEKFQAYSSLYEKERRVFDQQYRQFYNSKEWKDFRIDFLAKEENQFCLHCKKAFAQILHHVVPLKVDWNRRLDPTNIQGLCNPCHSKHELTERNKKA